jgi:hypothetical protein
MTFPVVKVKSARSGAEIESGGDLVFIRANYGEFCCEEWRGTIPEERLTPILPGEKMETPNPNFTALLRHCFVDYEWSG